jgi:rhodanese-related sulfurtransferase
MTLKRILFLLLSLSLVVFMSCSSDDDNPAEPGPTEFEMLAEVGDAYFTAYTNITDRGVNIAMGGDGGLFDLLTDENSSNDPQILDWRGSTDYDARHISGAINLAIGDLIDKVNDLTIDKDKHIVNVCYTGQTASIATATLNMLGYDAQNLLFGMCGVTSNTEIVPETHRWANQIAPPDDYTLNKTAVADPTTTYDFPTLSTGGTTADEVIAGRFSAVLDGGWGVTFANVIASPDDYFIINYWPKAEYDDPGHIEDAYQFTPKSSLKSTEMLNLLPTNKTVVIYCYTGQTSAQVSAYLRMLGYDAKSLYYGCNGFAYDQMSGHKYSEPQPDNAYVSVLEPAM